MALNDLKLSRSLCQDSLMNSRACRVPCGTPLCHPDKKFGGLKTRGTHHTCTSHQRCKHSINETVGVKHGHHIEATVALDQLMGNAFVVHARTDIRMGQWYEFRTC